MRKEICYSSGLSFRKTDMIPLDDAIGPVMEYTDSQIYPKAYEEIREGRVRFCLYYPHAHSVMLRTYSEAFELAGEGGYWRGEFTVGTGFIVLFITVDGNETLYPGLPIGFGGNRPINYIELGGESDGEEPLTCAHGTVSMDYFDSRTTGKLERIYVYLPPDYFTSEKEARKYPVLYLQHGHGENETAWVNQGKANFILDKLIAEKKAEPMILVMCNGMASSKSGEKIVIGSTEKFESLLTEEVIPYVEKKYRAFGDKEHRGMAGLSMGSMQTSVVTLKHQDLFDYVGIFSGFVTDILSGYAEHTKAEYLDTYSDRIRYIFRAMGEQDIFYEYFCADDKLLAAHHVAHERVVYEGAHEWKVWQRCLYDFAQKIFRENP